MKKIIIYDFDGTLTPYPITTFNILEDCGFIGGGNNKELQNLVVNKMKEKNINVYESFYEIILEVIESNGYPLTDKTISKGADNLEYNKGVIEYLEYLKNLNVDNYIVSSSLKCFLDKTIIANYFKKIYAGTFIYNNNNIVGIDYLMTDDKKIDAIKAIVTNNDYKNVIYIGDGLTDLKAMKHIKDNGGISIFVTDNINEVKKTEDMSYIFNRDFSINSELFKFINNFIQ